MLVILFGLIFLLVGEGVLFFEEETLIVCCGVFLIDALGGFVSKYVIEELERRGDTLKSMFLWYYESKQVIEELAISKHKERLEYRVIFEKLYSLLLVELLDLVLVKYLVTKGILRAYEVESTLINGGLEISFLLASKDLKWLLSVIEKHKTSGDIYGYQSPYEFAYEILSNVR